MAAEVEEIVLKTVIPFESVKTVGDLKENVKALKDNLSQLEIGTEQYSETLGELKLNQNALKDAMYATSSSMDQLTEAAQGAGGSYNALVHRMAAMKEELRTLDTHTTDKFADSINLKV